MSLPYRQRQHQRRGHYCQVQQCVALLACWLTMAASLTVPLHTNSHRGGRRLRFHSSTGRQCRCWPPSAAAERAVVMTSPTGGRKKLVVIGGGAAGYFGAIQAAACGSSASSLDVIVLEAGRLPLQKVKISGGGRCNVMHDTSKVGVRAGRCTWVVLGVLDTQIIGATLAQELCRGSSGS